MKYSYRAKVLGTEGRYFAVFKDLPVTAQGASRKELRKSALTGLKAHLKSLILQGVPIPRSGVSDFRGYMKIEIEESEIRPAPYRRIVSD